MIGKSHIFSYSSFSKFLKLSTHGHGICLWNIQLIRVFLSTSLKRQETDLSQQVRSTEINSPARVISVSC